MVTNRWKFDRILLIWLIATAGLNLLTHMVPTETAFYQMTQRMMNFPTYAYGLLVLTWMASLRREISDRYVRWKLACGGAMLLLLFVLRLLRWRVLEPGGFADRFCWYMYYVPIIVQPLLSVDLSLDIGGEHGRQVYSFIMGARHRTGGACADQ